MFKVFYKKFKHSLIENSFYLYAAHFADYILSLLILPLIARVLGPDELGDVVLAQTFGLLILLIMESGFSITATREVARLKNKKKDLKKYLGEAFSFKLLLIPIIIILSWIVIFYFPRYQLKPHYIWIVMTGAMFQGLAPTWFFQGIERFKIIAISKIIFRSIGFIIIFILIEDKDDGWIVLTCYSINSLLIFIYFIKKILSFTGKIKLVNFKSLNIIWNNSRWGFLLTMIPVFYQNSAAFLLGTKVSPLELGLYFGAFKIYRSFNTLYGPIGQAVYPRLISSNILDNKSSKILVKKVFFIMLSLGLLFCFLLLIIPDFFINILLGSKFIEASNTLQLFAIVLPLTAVSHVLGRQWMLVKGYEKRYSIILLFALLIAVSFLFLCVNHFGIQVVPISLILFELSTILMILIMTYKNNFF